MTETAKRSLSPLEILTPEVRLSFPTLFKPKAIPGATDPTPKFSLTVLIQPKTDMSIFVNAIKAAMIEKWGKVIQLPADKKPIKDCATFDYKSKRYSGYEDGWKFIRMSSKFAPAIVTRTRVPVTDESRVYPGMWVLVFANCFAWSHPTGGKGVSFGLNAVQLVRDGDRLDNRKSPDDVFESLGAPEGADASGDVTDMFA